MNINLLIRNGDAILIKRFFDTFNYIKVDRPVICALAPCARGIFQSGIRMLGQAHKRRGILQSQRMRRNNFRNNALYLLHVVIIGSGKSEINFYRF